MVLFWKKGGDAVTITSLSLKLSLPWVILDGTFPTKEDGMLRVSGEILISSIIPHRTFSFLKVRPSHQFESLKFLPGSGRFLMF